MGLAQWLTIFPPQFLSSKPHVVYSLYTEFLVSNLTRLDLFSWSGILCIGCGASSLPSSKLAYCLFLQYRYHLG